MSVVLIVTLVVIAATAVYFITVHKRLVALRESVKKARSNVDELLKQRHDELPKLVELCRQHMEHEREALDRVMEAGAVVWKAQACGDMPGLGEAEGDLKLGLGRLFALVEEYPELKANERFQHLYARISGLEEAIADRREFYNESAALNNMRIERFPDLIVARSLDFVAADLLEFSGEQTRGIDVKGLVD